MALRERLPLELRRPGAFVTVDGRDRPDGLGVRGPCHCRLGAIRVRSYVPVPPEFPRAQAYGLVHDGEWIRP